MRSARILTLAAALLAWATLADAKEIHDLDDDPEGHDASLMYEVVPLSRGESLDPASAQRDLAYIDMMSQHHAGAQKMAEAYLADPRGTNPVLRKLADAIITNQGFELGVLARAKESVARPPQILDLGFQRLAIRELGVDGLEHRWRFIPKPAPTTLELDLTPGAEVSAYDVAFAKGMVMHHQAALDMAWKYNQDPLAQNRVLRLMNLDIIRAQRYEIGFLESVVARYPGDADAVQPVMPMGMPMEHGGGGEMHTGGGGSSSPPTPSGQGVPGGDMDRMMERCRQMQGMDPARMGPDLQRMRRQCEAMMRSHGGGTLSESGSPSDQ